MDLQSYDNTQQLLIGEYLNPSFIQYFDPLIFKEADVCIYLFKFACLMAHRHMLAIKSNNISLSPRLETTVLDWILLSTRLVSLLLGRVLYNIHNLVVLHCILRSYSEQYSLKKRKTYSCRARYRQNYLLHLGCAYLNISLRSGRRIMSAECTCLHASVVMFLVNKLCS